MSAPDGWPTPGVEDIEIPEDVDTHGVLGDAHDTADDDDDA
jgi:hypothetical protein